jgi:hypothetical protein
MQSEISQETAKLFQAALASGKYTSVDELIAAMAIHFQHYGKDIVTQNMPEHIAIEELTKSQGAKAFDASSKAPSALWPDDESVDDLLACIHESRQDDARSGLRYYWSVLL